MNKPKTLQTIFTNDLRNVSGGLTAPPFVRTAVEKFGRPEVWNNAFNYAKGVLSEGKALSWGATGDRNIARDYANQQAFRNLSGRTPTAEQIRDGFGLE
jgi:hypothetical protein